MPLEPAQYSEILFRHPPGSTENPSATLAPLRITRLKCVVPRSDEWSYAATPANTDDFPIPTGVYFGGVYIRLRFVDVVLSA